MLNRANITIFVNMTPKGNACSRASYQAYLSDGEGEENLGIFRGVSLAAALNKAALYSQLQASEEVISVGLKVEEQPVNRASPRYAYCDTTLRDWGWERAKQVADYLLDSAK